MADAAMSNYNTDNNMQTFQLCQLTESKWQMQQCQT